MSWLELNLFIVGYTAFMIVLMCVMTFVILMLSRP